MPHLEIKYSANIQFDLLSLFDRIEFIINEMDPSAGVCKSRAYPAEIYKDSHIMLDLWLLLKPHRDAVFSQILIEKLSDCLKSYVDNRFVSIQIHYRDLNYKTIE